jgi:hypothetical protein
MLHTFRKPNFILLSLTSLLKRLWFKRFYILSLKAKKLWLKNFGGERGGVVLGFEFRPSCMLGRHDKANS